MRRLLPSARALMLALAALGLAAAPCPAAANGSQPQRPLRMNEIQVIGTHNSYHRELSPAERMARRGGWWAACNLTASSLAGLGRNECRRRSRLASRRADTASRGGAASRVADLGRCHAPRHLE